MSRILVTGASGFVGHILCRTLLAQGFEVTATVRRIALLPERHERLYQEIEVGDIHASTDWSSALKGVNTLVHLAARVHVMKDVASDPLAEFLKVNLDGTVNLARQAARVGVKRLVYVSSVKVNGEETQELRSYVEQDMPAPQDPYGVSKWEAERALQLIAQETGLEVVVVRPPLVYGPGVKGNFIRLLAAVDKEIPLPLAGANNARSLVYVGNLVNALICCATHPAARGQTYLVSDGKSVSTAVLVEKIAKALGRKSRSFYFPPGLIRFAAIMLGRSAQVDRLFGSLRVNDEKIHRELSWTPPYTLDQGLHETVDWYQKSKAAH